MGDQGRRPLLVFTSHLPASMSVPQTETKPTRSRRTLIQKCSSSLRSCPLTCGKTKNDGWRTGVVRLERSFSGGRQWLDSRQLRVVEHYPYSRRTCDLWSWEC